MPLLLLASATAMYCWRRTELLQLTNYSVSLMRLHILLVIWQRSIRAAMKFKLVSMVHNCLHHKAPRYLTDYCDVASRRHLCSARRHYLVVPWQSQLVWGQLGHLLLPAQLPGTHWAMICVIWHLALIVSDVCLKRGCFQSTSTFGALEVSHFMRYINSWLTYDATQTLTGVLPQRT